VSLEADLAALVALCVVHNGLVALATTTEIERDRVVITCSRAGIPKADIATAAGVTPAAVERIVQGSAGVSLSG
jgi:hypothetical protein